MNQPIDRYPHPMQIKTTTATTVTDAPPAVESGPFAAGVLEGAEKTHLSSDLCTNDCDDVKDPYDVPPCNDFAFEQCGECEECNGVNPVEMRVRREVRRARDRCRERAAKRLDNDCDDVKEVPE